jgi:RecA/RadA recombinase
MAKKKEGFTFTDVGKLFDESIQSTSVIVEKKNKEKEFISTGIYMLDAVLSASILNGGILNNRITVFAGESGVGKSFLCFNVAREAQKKGYIVVYIDTENAIERADMPKYGIDVDNNFILLRSNKVEDLNIMMTKVLDSLKEEKKKGVELPKMIFFLDSIGQLASNKEKEDLLDGKIKQDMTRAKAIGSLFRSINSDLGFLDMPLVVTNHTYLSMDLFPQEIMKGGRALAYSATTVVYLSKAKLKTGLEDEMDLGQSGIIITAKAVKNRLARPKKNKFELSFVSGSNPYNGLEFFCTQQNFEKLGIAQGKMEVDKSTGELLFRPGGTKWYVRHLDKSVYEKQLFNKAVFTPEVLQALEPIINSYFSYGSVDEIEEVNSVLDGTISEGDYDTLDLNSGDISAADLFD